MNRKQFALIVVMVVIAGLVGGAVSSWFFMGEPVFAQKTTDHDKVITAGKFELVDKNGDIRGQLAVSDEDGTALFSLHGKDGVPTMVLGVGRLGEPSLAFLNKNGDRQIGLWIEGEAAAIGLYGKDGEGDAGLIIAEGKPMIFIKGVVADRESMAVLGTGHDGSPGFSLVDSNANIRASLRILETGDPLLELKDDNNRTRAVLGYTELETTSTGEVTKRPPSSLVLFNKEGKTIWSAP